MVLVLAGMVGWLYWQQQRLFQNMNNIIAVVGELARPPPMPEPEEPTLTTEEVAPTTEETAPAPVREEAEEDDRVSVDEDRPADVVTGPPAPLDTDNLEDKTKKELQDILTKRGIPYSKADNKGALISLLKATA